MKKKLQTMLILLGTLLFLSASVQSTKAINTYGITNITKTPQTLHQNENMTVTVEFVDGSLYDLVKLLVCQLEPVYRCDAFPVIMQNTTDDIYAADYLIQFDIGTVVGFTIIIVFENFTTAQLPETSEFLGLEIVEPVAESYYIAAGTVSEIDDTSGFSYFLVGLTVLVVAIAIKRRKK
ncbi:MAG: hypothetical protein H7641_05465 [Candidatus Heimdallarchaeota archaeon]|nr:hypothetical protein [Candidatus Heimdallarchaeota archaeon]MCK4877010.1 hypothetical protein [Candidatus Heimdallarchaeota archaeon]